VIKILYIISLLLSLAGGIMIVVTGNELFILIFLCGVIFWGIGFHKSIQEYNEFWIKINNKY